MGISLEEHEKLHGEANKANAAPANPAREPGSGSPKRTDPQKVYSLDTIIDFGKHDGDQVEDVIYDDPSYMQWVYEKTQRVLGEDTIALMQSEGII